jgi:IclR family transcriptional regulator, acetate operon repressor
MPAKSKSKLKASANLSSSAPIENEKRIAAESSAFGPLTTDSVNANPLANDSPISKPTPFSAAVPGSTAFVSTIYESSLPSDLLLQPEAAVGESKTTEGKSGEGTAALEKALDIFEAIGSEPQGISQADLSARLKVPRTTLYRLLASLVARGLVRRDPVRRVYLLGFKCFELARQAHSSGDLVAASASELRGLRDLTGETAYLGIAEGYEILSLERFDGAHSERSNAALGQRKPMHCTSQGKAILAAMTEAKRDQLIREMPLKAVTPKTIVDRRRLVAEIRVSTARGYSIDDEEIVEGIRCVGAAIIDSDGIVRGAISVAGPAWRMTLERFENLGPELAEAARRIGAELKPTAVTKNQTMVNEQPGPWAFEGSSPCWSPLTKKIYYADRLAPAIFSLSMTEGAQVIEVAKLDSPIVNMALIDHGRLMVRCTNAVHVFETMAAPMSEARDVLSESEPIIIDPQCTAVCSDQLGNLWACSPTNANSQQGGSSQYGLPTTQWVVGPINHHGQGESHWRLNEPLDSLAWDDRRQTLYGASSTSGNIVMMQVGKPSVRRLTTVPKASGRISGLTVDHDAGVWTTLRDGWSIMRFSSEGTLDRVISMPVPQPSGVCFVPSTVAEAPARLFVTSSRHGVSVDVLAKGPLSGQLFEINLQE